MKKALVIIFALVGFSAFSQSLLVNSFDGGCEFIKTSTNDTAYYSNNTSGFAYVRGSGMTYLFTKVGGQIGSAYLFSDISVNDSVYATRETFVNAINALPFFSSVAASGVDSGEVIGDYLYLFSSTDTVIIDVSTLSGGDSIWQVSAGKVVNVDTTKQFRFEYGHYGLVNDTLVYNEFFKVPFAGSIYREGDSILIFNGVQDLSSVPGVEYPEYMSKFLNFNTAVENDVYAGEINSTISSGKVNMSGLRVMAAGFESSIGVYEGDSATARIYTTYNEVSGGTGEVNALYVSPVNGFKHNLRAGEWKIINYQASNAELKYNANGVVFPSFSSDPTGENGAIYYNTTSNVFRKYANGSWSDL